VVLIVKTPPMPLLMLMLMLCFAAAFAQQYLMHGVPSGLA
jgi:hypothetical protein